MERGRSQVKSEVGSERDHLMRLIRRIAREEAWEVVDAMHEHLSIMSIRRRNQLKIWRLEPWEEERRL